MDTSIICVRILFEGNWGDWNDWSTCSVSCGSGQQFRYRFCDNPNQTPDGKVCEGSGTGSQYETQDCDEGGCPPER